MDDLNACYSMEYAFILLRSAVNTTQSSDRNQSNTACVRMAAVHQEKNKELVAFEFIRSSLAALLSFSPQL